MNLTTTNRRRGFTLVEMIGVLAVIAVLAGLLLPRVFSAINQSRINTTALGYNSAKSGALLYFGKHGNFGTTASGTFGATLLGEGFMEKPFEGAIATDPVADSDVETVAASPYGTALTVSGTYDLSGSTTNTVIGGLVVQAVLANVPIADAQELSTRIDGAGLSTADGAVTTDTEGRVKYAAPTAGLTTVYLYLAHK